MNESNRERCIREEIIKRIIDYNNVKNWNAMFILVSMSTPLEFVSGELEYVPWLM